MKQLFLFVFTLLAAATQAQDRRTIYYNAEWDSTSRANAFYSREITETNGLYKIADNYINGDKLQTGYLSKITADNWNYREGHWVFYHPSGFATEDGDYKEGNKTGLWTVYRPHSTTKSKDAYWKGGKVLKAIQYTDKGEVSEVETFKNDQKIASVEYKDGDSTVTTYTYYGGTQLVQTTEVSGKNTIVTDYTYEGENKATEQRTKNGKIVYNRNHDEVTEYYDNGRIWKKGSRNKKGELKWQDCYGTDGRDTSCKTSEGTFQFVEQMPAPGFNMMEHLINNMHYPEVCRLRNIEGRVLVQFVVYEDGAIGDVIIKKSVHPALDAEAYRVISIMPKWKPGMQNGKKVKVFYTQPITFKLQ